MLTLRKVAVTGGISCGKSLVCHLFKQHGAYVVSADRIVHQLLSYNSPLAQNVINLLGNDILGHYGIDRQLVAKKVFSNPELLKHLEKLLHPKVIAEIEQEFRDVQKEKTSWLFIAEIPLLFENQLESLFDNTITVWADPKQSLKRFVDATQKSEADYHLRISHQLCLEEKIKKANFVIENNGTRKQLHQQVWQLYKHLYTLANQ